MYKRRKSKYLIIPNRIMNTRLTMRNKFLFGLITQQINTHLACHQYPCFTLTNNQISHCLPFSSTVINKYITTLKRKNYISTTPISKKDKGRTITLTRYGWRFNTGHYEYIPNIIIHSHLCLTRQYLLGYILSWSSSFFQRNKTIARKTHSSISSVKANLKYLIQHHYLNIIKPNQNDKHRYLKPSRRLQWQIKNYNHKDTDKISKVEYKVGKMLKII